MRGWIEAQVEVAGDIEQPHVRPWSTVLRVPTRDGSVVWFKAARAAFAHESRVIALLRPLVPRLLPEVLASTDEGWLLLADAGRRAREHPIDWAAMLGEYARLQQASAAVAGDLLAAGAHDNRPQHLARRAEALAGRLPGELAARLRDRFPDIERAAERLAASRLPVTVDHGDLHDANVFSDGHSVRLLDWGDSAVAHPFFSLSTAEPEDVAPTLAAWEGSAPRSELEEESAIVLDLRFLVRALNWEDVAALGETEHLVDRIRRFVSPAAYPH